MFWCMLRFFRRNDRRRDIDRDEPFSSIDRFDAFQVAGMIRGVPRWQRLSGWIESLLEDIRLAFRSLRRNIRLSIAVVTILTLAVGLNTVMFTMINGLAFQAPAKNNPESYFQIADVSYRTGSIGRNGNFVPIEDYFVFRDRASSIGEMAAWSPASARLGQDSDSQTTVALVTCSFFTLDRVRPLLGRLLDPTDCVDAAPVIVLSEQVWKTRFGADSAIVGKLVRFNGHPVTVVGVSPRFLIGLVDAWLPYTTHRHLGLGDTEYPADVLVVGRVKSGFDREDVSAELTVIAGQQDLVHSGRSTRSVTVTNGSLFAEQGKGEFFRILIPLLIGIFGLVVLVACANVATLLMSRAISRRREVAVRISLGAGRGRLLRMLVTESLILSVCAGVISVYLAYVAAPFLKASLEMPFTQSMTPDWRVFAYLSVVTLVAGALSGMTPALESINQGVSEALKAGNSLSYDSRARLWQRKSLISVQVALSLALLVFAGMFVRAHHATMVSDLALDARQVLVSRLPLSSLDPDSAVALRRDLAERIAILPQVESLAFSSKSLGVSSRGGQMLVEPPGQVAVGVNYIEVSTQYFETIGISMLSGRGFQESDAASEAGLSPIVVSREFVRRFLSDREPVGVLMHSGDETLEVVGVARDSFITWGHEPDEPVVYRPLSALDSRSILVRFVGDGTGLATAVRGITRELFPDAFDNPRTLASILEESRTWLRTVGNLLSVLGIVALGMALIGVYGAVSFSVGERQRELALRTALGARASDLFYRVLGLHWKPVAIGILVGLPLAVAGGMIFNSQLHARLRTDDPLLCAGMSIALVASALLATLAPARKGISSDPMQALREE